MRKDNEGGIFKMAGVAFIFAGQGSQYVSMGKDLFDGNETVHRIYEAMTGSAEEEIKISFNGPDEELKRTKNTQVALYVEEIAIANALLEKGINVAIGTDSVASNNNLSFLEEIKTMALVAKVKHVDPTLITPAQALYAATRGGALAQGRDDCGVLKEGMKADLLAFRTDTPEMNPVHDMMNNMVYSASDGDIAMTMIDGEVLYEDGEFTKLDTERICFEAGKATEGILKEL